MKHLNLLIAIFSILCLASCAQQELVPSHETTPEEMVTQIKKTGKLYVTEYVVEKLVTANAQNTVKGSVFGKSISVDMSIGERKIAIPNTVAFYEDGKWDAAAKEAMFKSAEVKMRKIALTPEYLEMARQQAQTRFESLFKALGFNETIVNFNN